MLTNKTALVTGGLGDLGQAMALHLAQAGANVVIWDLLPEADDRLQPVRASGRRVAYQQVDVANRAEVDAAMDKIAGNLDIVCSNAGIVESAPFLEISGESWQKHLEVNLTGCFNVGQAAARLMVKKQIPGRIIFTSSWVGSIPWPEIAAYTVTKAGVNMLVRQMARELAVYGICVNAVAPGIVRAGLAGRQLAE
ncbi:MAG: SDR family oxidoreductase, partial [Anaerolineae bacterium]|nr:SDR family oxidoreductase [Anaerolineae bacterium]